MVIIVTALVHVPAYSQGDTTALLFYRSAELTVREDPETASHFLKKAITISRQEKDWDLFMKSLNRLASMDSTGREKFSGEVFAWLKEAADIFKDSKKTSELALLHFNIGKSFYLVDHDIELSLYHYESAKNIWTMLEGNWEAEIATCYHFIGDVYKYLKSDFLEAENFYEKSLQIRETIRPQDSMALFRNYYNLATTNRSQRDFEKALSYGTKTLEIAKKMHNSIFQEMTHGVVAGIYRDMGDSELAKEHYHTAITLNKKTNDPKKTLGWYYQGLGETLKNDSLYDEAIDNFLKAYDFHRKENSSPSLIVYLLQKMADTYALVRDEKRFYRTIRELFDEYKSSGMMRSRQAWEAFVIFGNYHYRKNQYDSALHYYQQALIASIPTFHSEKVEENPSEGMIGFNYYVHAALSKKALAFRGKFLAEKKSHYWLNALECLRLSEKLLSQERNTLDMQDAQWEFLDLNYDIYEDIISLLYDGNNYLQQDTLHALAFHYFEQSKSRSLADALISAERTTEINKQDTLFNVHAQLKRNLLTAQDKLSRELDNQNRPDVVTKLREDIVTLDRSIQRCKLEIEEKFPGYFNVKYGYKPPALRDLQKIISRDNKVIIEYFWGRDWVYALGITDDNLLFQRIGKPGTTEAIIDSVLSHFEDDRTSTDLKDFNRFTSSAYHLHQFLVQPLSAILVNKERIQINPDGPISKVPFEILLEQDASGETVNYRSLKFMIKSFAIGYAYSSSMLVHKSRNVIRRPSLLAVGLISGRPGNEMEDIDVGAKELDLLSRRFEHGKFLTGDAATESNFKSLSPDFDIIHLAIHGSGDVKRDYSACLYFKSQSEAADDGELHAYELYGLKLKASMAVLTACESGLGKGYKGEGMMSMASAFTYSGCENILMSLWKVNDQASNILMDDFYSQLLEGVTIDDALRAAKLRYLERADELTADPKIWAPLVAYGTVDRVFRNDNISSYVIIGSVALLGLLVVFVVRKKSKH